MNEKNLICFDTLIIGGGPAGTGLLLKALKDGGTNGFFNRRVALVEQSSQLIAGNITQYQVNSDTLSDVFLECLEGATSNFFNLEQLSAEIELVQSYKGKSIPLPKLAAYFNKLGALLKEALTAAQKCTFFMNTIVERVVQDKNGIYSIHLSGRQQLITARQIVLATGGIPKTQSDTTFAHTISLSPYCDKIIHTDTILRLGLGNDLKISLKNNPRVVILGGSHSAFSAAHYLLNGPDGITFKNGDIQIWSTRLPKIYFNNKAEALASGYDDFGEDDFCPVTGKLYRLAGLRMDGRALYMQMLGLGHAIKENRVVHNVFTNQMLEIEEQLKSAALIISAYGYQLNRIPFFDANGDEIQFNGTKTNRWVNDNCELLDKNEKAIPSVFATGMATGFIPKGELGGEPTFNGQTNGIWYYQNAIADLIMRNLGVMMEE